MRDLREAAIPAAIRDRGRSAAVLDPQLRSKDGLRVRDHGSGIAPEDLPHIFDRFYRGTNSRSRPGSGLGLAIVRQVVEQHHGTVTAVNAPDGGAILTVTLPFKETPGPHNNQGAAREWDLPDAPDPASR
jgi:signal transduction histidine kinase